MSKEKRKRTSFRGDKMNKRRLKPIGKHFDKTVWCLLLGQYCYKECPHYYHREENRCMKRIKKTNKTKGGNNE